MGGEHGYADELGYIVRYKRYCHCPAGDRLKAEAQENARKSRERRVRVFTAEAGMPPNLVVHELGESPHRELAKRMAAADPASSWYLSGEYGHGKSTLACAYLRHWVQRTARRAEFITSPDLLCKIRSTYDGPGSEFDLIAYLGEVPLLVLDDLGAESMRSGEWVEEKFYQIVYRRLSNSRATVYTSNLSPRELMDRIGRRVGWRVLEQCGQENLVEVKGRNYRMCEVPK